MPSVKILIVEDENIIARDICVRLEHFGYAVAATVDDILIQIGRAHV